MSYSAPPPGYGHSGQPAYGDQPGYRDRSRYGDRPRYGYESGYEAGAYPGSPDAGPAAGGGPPLAHRGKRMFARMIDTTVFGFVASLFGVPMMITMAANNPAGKVPMSGLSVIAVAAFAGYFVYEGVQLALWGRTLGKLLTGLRVVSADAPYAPLSTARAYGRAAFYPMGLSLLGMIPVVGMVNLVDALWQFWDTDHQCLHDKVARTIVIESRAYRE